MRTCMVKRGLYAGIGLLAGLGQMAMAADAKLAVDCVDPFIGTGGHGHTFPGATTPYGMVQLSPDTRTIGWDASSGYHYTDQTILGFSHTHLSGTGIGDMGDILFMPFTDEAQFAPGDTEEDPSTAHRSRFSHDREHAEPGYYQVQLLDDDINVELTATPRAGMHRYTFPEGEQASLIIDIGHTLHGHENPITELRVINRTEIEGYKRTKGWAANHHVYFHAKFDRPFTCSFFNDGEEATGNWITGHTNLQAVLRFDASDRRQVQAKVGISAVDYEGAQRNLEAEIAHWDFDWVRQSARDVWQHRLQRIQVKGNTEDTRTIFYTALYHCAINPSLFTDVDGRYRGVDQRIHRTEGSPIYTVFSLWDTFRSFHPLLTIIDPDINNDFIKTLITQYEQGGMLPKWELAGNYTGTMFGYHALPVIADAYAKGQRDFDVPTAYQAMLKSSRYNDGDFLYPASARNVRDRLDSKAKLFNETYGFIPCELERRSVTRGLEYAYDDWCIAQMAAALDKPEDEAIYRERAGRYQAYFDPETGFMRAKHQDGTWKTPFSPKFSRHGDFEYGEGNAWQWTWFVPHDVPGLAELMGGRKAFIAKLDELFTTDSTIEGEEASVDISGMIGQYAHGNEPDHHVAHMYNGVGEGWKTQEIVDQILTTLYFNDPNGLSGNEDCGAMSSWYVLNAMGFYSFCPGLPKYSLGRPLFDEVVIPLKDGKQFVIRVSNNSPDNKYIQSARLNQVPLTDLFFTHEQLMQGGLLEISMGSQPVR